MKLTFNSNGCLQALLNKSGVANFDLCSLKSIEGPISSSSTLGNIVPDFLRRILGMSRTKILMTESVL